MLLDREDGLREILDSRDSPMGFATGTEYQSHASLCDLARRVAQTATARGRSRPSFGSLAGGIDWKATLVSFATGEENVYVHDVPHRSRAARAIDTWTPIVFLLASEQEIDGSVLVPVMDANPAQDALNQGIRNFPLSTSPMPDHVYSVVTAVQTHRSLHANHIRQDRLTAIGFQFASPLMGPARYELVTRRPARFHCRTDPDNEHDFAGMSKSERIVAWAVKYAVHSVLVVAAPGWKPSQRVARYGQGCGVEIRALPVSAFSPDHIERMKTMHFVSRNLKRHPRCGEILDHILF